MSILEVKSVSKSFGGVKANVDISVSVEQGSIVGLIGPNGSGKTTLFNSIVGTHPIDQGSIVFDNTEVSQMPVPAVAKLGLLRTFQQTRRMEEDRWMAKSAGGPQPWEIKNHSIGKCARGIRQVSPLLLAMG